MNKCTECGSMAINPRLRGRQEGVDLDLCDVCYWRKRAASAGIIEPSKARDDLFELLDNEHGLSLVESQLDSIIYCVLNALKIKAIGCGMVVTMGELKTNGE
jgi:hypothetical protein